MTREVQRADSAFRNQVLGLLVVLTLLLVFVVLRLEAYFVDLQDLAETSRPEAGRKALLAARVFFAVIAAGSTVLAAFLGRLSWGTLRAGRCPPPSSRVIRDTVVLRGNRARLYDWITLTLAVFVLAAGLLVSYRAERGVRSLLKTTLGPTVRSPAELGVR